VIALALIPILVSTLSRAFLTGYLTVVAAKGVLGQPVSAREAWGHVRPRLWALLGVSVLYTLIVLGGSLLLLVPGIWLYVLYSLASVALVLEGAKITESLGRSSTLLSGAWWRTFGLLLVANIIAVILALIVQIPFNLLDDSATSSVAPGAPVTTTTALVFAAIAGIIAETITLPFLAGVTVLVYVDRRMRREGLDIELIRQAGAGH
jgi:hypothetical protein